jgi:hypothetical protein
LDFKADTFGPMTAGGKQQVIIVVLTDPTSARSELVPPVRVERTLPYENKILSLARLPIPPRGPVHAACVEWLGENVNKADAPAAIMKLEHCSGQPGRISSPTLSDLWKSQAQI